ncbi:dihydrofolate reductase-like [Asterias amurensis]|uniref:dihydrofolate reductase-like n=1 Tax=Asterias amurensis TaxID=7602 RepID=UPI003AB24A9C
MAHNHGDHSVQFDMIVAADDKMGIGIAMSLPWKLPTDRKFYLDKTNKVSPLKKNALICGRLTGSLSQREKNPNVLRFILSNTLEEKPPHADYLCKNLDEALAIIGSPEVGNVVDNVWIIGGSAVYKAGLESPHLRRYYITRVYGDFKCDAFCPDVDLTKFKLVSDPDIGSHVYEENGIRFKFEAYERI